jgi:hypothetical protein
MHQSIHFISSRISNDMHSALYSARKLVASLALGFCLAQLATPAVLAAQTVNNPAPETIILTPDERLLANHGGEAATGGAAVIGGASGAPLLGTVKSRQVQAGYSDSLWGSMLLNMAVQRDEELQKFAKRLGLVNTMTLLSIAGVSGLGLAQSIYAYRQIQPETVNVTEAHHAGGHDHVHMPLNSKVPSAIGIIGSGVTLATLGTRAVMDGYITRRIARRQVQLRESIDHILSHLELEGITSHGRQELAGLVGERAAGEFLLLWRAVHHSDNL